MLTELFTWLGERKLRPHVSRAYPLAEAPQALAALLARKAVGKLVLKP
jgi:NADPH2:quinone reductase